MEMDATGSRLGTGTILLEKGYTWPQIMPDCWQLAWRFAYILPLVLNLVLSPLALSSFVMHATEAFNGSFYGTFTLQIVLINRHVKILWCIKSLGLNSTDERSLKKHAFSDIAVFVSMQSKQMINVSSHMNIHIKLVMCITYTQSQAPHVALHTLQMCW